MNDNANGNTNVGFIILLYSPQQDYSGVCFNRFDVFLMLLIFCRTDPITISFKPNLTIRTKFHVAREEGSTVESLK